MTLAISIGSALLFCAVTCKPLLTSSGSSPRDIGVFTEPLALSLARPHYSQDADGKFGAFRKTQDMHCWVQISHALMGMGCLTWSDAVHPNVLVLLRRRPRQPNYRRFASTVCDISGRSKLPKGTCRRNLQALGQPLLLEVSRQCRSPHNARTTFHGPQLGPYTEKHPPGIDVEGKIPVLIRLFDDWGGRRDDTCHVHGAVELAEFLHG